MEVICKYYVILYKRLEHAWIICKYYVMLYKRLEHAWILQSSWVLEQINSQKI